jgi:lipoprotein-anchoring transpeptidase ErfK/SrfK
VNQRPIATLRAPRTVIVVRRDKFELHLHRRKRGSAEYVRTIYPIAVGKIGDRTPAGAYFVDAKTRKPAWKIPEDPDFAKETWGSIVPFGSAHNPFAGGFLSLSDEAGVGIHGTSFPPQLGTRASHGCIRMAVKDFEELYPRVPLGTPVTII